MKALWIWILVSAASLVSSKLTFHGDKVYRVNVQTEEHVALIERMDKQFKLDFWHPDSAGQLAPKMVSDFHVNINHSASIQDLLEQNAIQYEILFHNLQEGIEAQLDNPRSQKAKKYSYDNYNNWENISSWTCQMASKYPKLIKRIFIGNTAEGRAMNVLRIGTSSAEKRAIFIDCGIHAREWISPAFCQWFVKELARGYKKNKSIMRILRKAAFYVLPVLNIDGYVWSWEKDRMWRKNRAPSSDKCVGTDLNRNFNASWCTVGSSHKPCSDIYCGSAAESETETKNVATFIRSLEYSIKAYITVHSYSQMLMYPYGYTYKLVPNSKELHEIAKGAVAALYGKYKTTYEYGPSAVVIYETSGGSDDWAYDEGIKYSFTFELRDNGKHGFLLPESQIRPTCKETMMAVNYIADYVISHT
ncbi:carboxypeptidase B-like [Discoglossus pictus]